MTRHRLLRRAASLALLSIGAACAESPAAPARVTSVGLTLSQSKVELVSVASGLTRAIGVGQAIVIAQYQGVTAAADATSRRNTAIVGEVFWLDVDRRYPQMNSGPGSNPGVHHLRLLVGTWCGGGRSSQSTRTTSGTYETEPGASVRVIDADTKELLTTLPLEGRRVSHSGVGCPSSSAEWSIAIPVFQ